MKYIKNTYYIENISLNRLAKKFSTPFIVILTIN